MSYFFSNYLDGYIILVVYSILFCCTKFPFMEKKFNEDMAVIYMKTDLYDSKEFDRLKKHL